MIISDLDYLESIPETSATHINGGAALAVSEFSADTYGSSTNISTKVRNRAISDPSNSYHAASSYVNMIVTFNGKAFVSSNSYASVVSVE